MFRYLHQKISAIFTHRQFPHILESQRAGLSPLRPHQGVDLVDSGAAVQDFLDEHFAHKAGSSGDEDGLPLVKLRT